jgi:hypothetical protein
MRPWCFNEDAWKAAGCSPRTLENELYNAFLDEFDGAHAARSESFTLRRFGLRSDRGLRRGKLRAAWFPFGRAEGAGGQSQAGSASLERQVPPIAPAFPQASPRHLPLGLDA